MRGRTGRVCEHSVKRCHIDGGEVDFETFVRAHTRFRQVESLFVVHVFDEGRGDVAFGNLFEIEFVHKEPAVRERAVCLVRGLGLVGVPVGVFDRRVARSAFGAEPYGHIVTVIFELVALNVESVGLPAVGGDALVRACRITVGVNLGAADKHVVGRCCRDTLDDDVFAVAARKDNGRARAVYAVGVNVERKRVEFVLLDGYAARGLDALRSHKLLREHKYVRADGTVAEFLNTVVARLVCDCFEATCGDVGRFLVGVCFGLGVVSRGILAVVVRKLARVDDCVVAQRGRRGIVTAAVARHERPAVGGCRRRKRSRAEIEASVGHFESCGRGGLCVFVVCFLVEDCLRIFVAVFEFGQSEVVKHRITRGKTRRVRGGILAEREHNAERGRGRGRTFDNHGICDPFALRVDCVEFRISVGTDVNACAGRAVFRAFDVLCQNVYGKFIIAAFCNGERGRRIAVSGRNDRTRRAHFGNVRRLQQE